MTAPVRREDLARIKKLALLPDEVRRSRWAVSVTKLTSLKSLCKEPEVASRFADHLARKTIERVRRGEGRSSHLDADVRRTHQELMADAMAEMESWLKQPGEERRRRLLELQGRMRSEQNEHKNVPFGAARIIHDWDLLVFENALNCMLAPAREAGRECYQLARDYAERYDSSQGTGLISSSVQLLQDIADFWLAESGLDLETLAESGLDLETLAAPSRGKKAKQEPGPVATSRTSEETGKKSAKFTPRQGQFLAFIHLYRRLHRRGPAEQDLVIYFGLTPPTVHGMLVKLEGLGLITREPGVARSARVAVPEAEIPPLDAVEGPAW